jgi:tetratricopeptide (TPR) repeat protein
MRKMATLEERRGSSPQALRWLRRAGAAIPLDATDPTWLSARANVALTEAAVRARQGDDETCIALARSAVADAERAGDERTRALALERIHLGLVGLVAEDADEVGRQALDAHRRSGDHSAMARVLINLGVEAYYASQWDEATACYLEAMEAADRAGSTVLSSGAALNSAEVMSDQGHWTRALELFDRAARNYEAVGYSVGTAAAHLFAAVATMRLGELERARELIDRARGELTDLGRELADDLDSRELELAVLDATATVEDCDDLERRLGEDHPLWSRVRRCRGLVALLDGRRGEAETILSEALERKVVQGFERALTIQALVLVHGAAAPPALITEMEAIYVELGVEHRPPLVPAELSNSGGIRVRTRT